MSLQSRVVELLEALGRFLWRPVSETPWSDWRGFWLQQVFDDRFVVVYCLALVPVLLVAPRRWFRHVLVLTGLAFLAYVFGVFYAVCWLLTCVAFYGLAERFAVECRRTDVLPIGPPLAAGFAIFGWYLFVQALQHLDLPPAWDAWLFEHARFIYPLGARALASEPDWLGARSFAVTGTAPDLFRCLLTNPHNIGVAYFTVRMGHYFAEIKRDGIPRERRTLLNFLAYLCYAPNLIQGPIERFIPFQSEMDGCHERRSWLSVPPALLRMGWGVGKALVGWWYFRPLAWEGLGIGNSNLIWLAPEKIESYALLYFSVFIQIYWLYLEFSGYCDVSAGIAKLLGYRQVENFNWCWLATSLRDFWRRWHISLSLILRDYVYIALGGNRRHQAFNLCFTFFVCGIWHVPNGRMALWGLLMGAMLVINQWWVHWMERLDAAPRGLAAGIRRAWLRLRPLPQVCAWLLTMHAFVFSLLVFFGGRGGWRVAVEIVRRPIAWLLA